jgi:two-component system LytT family response regulator
MRRVLLIDDEPGACDIMRMLLAEHPGVRVVGEAGTIVAARILLQAGGYDVVFLDIQLRGGSGFDLVPDVRPEARTIFVTAYDEHALRAFEVNALDYLVKPVAPERLAASLARLGAAPRPESATSPRLTVDDRVLLKLGAGNERFVRVGDIRCIASEENYSEVFVGMAGERLLVRRTMLAWEQILPAEKFVRVHRQTIVNADWVQGIARETEAVFLLRLGGLAKPVSASYRYVPALRERLASRT